MPNVATIVEIDHRDRWQVALLLGWLTIIYNIIEGVLSMMYGIADEALTLAGFGADSFIEVVSAIGIVHMIMRLRDQGSAQRDQFERTALRVTGTAFYGLTFVLVTMAALSVIVGRAPESTVAATVISLISIAGMWLLIHWKMHIGTELKSDPIIADAKCSRVCLQMSIVLLVSSVLVQVTGFGWFDAIGAVWLAWYSYHEGRECFEKANGQSCDDHCCSPKAP